MNRFGNTKEKLDFRSLRLVQQDICDLSQPSTLILIKGIHSRLIWRLVGG